MKDKTRLSFGSFALGSAFGGMSAAIDCSWEVSTLFGVFSFSFADNAAAEFSACCSVPS